MKSFTASTATFTVKRILGILIPIALLALLLSALTLSFANDMYAFVKKDRDIPLEISSPLSLSEFSSLLQDRGIISNPAIFRMYVLSKDKKDIVEGFVGTAELNSKFSYRQILQVISAQNQ